MKKKFVIWIFLPICILAIAFGSTYSIIYKGVPLANTVVMGSQNIVVPTNLTEDDKSFTTMSFNIKCFAKTEAETHYWSHRKSALLELVVAQNADILGFQEVTHPQYKFLMNNLDSKYAYVGIYRSGLNFERANTIMKQDDPAPTLLNLLTSSTIIDEATPIFYNKSRYELIKNETFWLSTTPQKPSKSWGAKCRRICTYAQLKDCYTNEIINVLNTHFDHGKEKARLESVELVQNFIKENNLQNIIIMGDFNATEDSLTYNAMTKGNISNTKYLAPASARDTGATFNGFGKSTSESTIDYIFITNDCFEVVNTKIIADQINEDTYISDHYAISTKLKLL